MTGSWSRRSFLKASAATAAALALGPSRWGWAVERSPFGPLQDDPLLRLPEGFQYRIVAESGTPLTGGLGPWIRPNNPDLNVVFPQPDGKLLLCTSHEIDDVIPLLPPPPTVGYDRLAGGAITSVLLNPDLTIAETALNAGGMITNCSGSGTPWGTVLTGEEETITLEAEHGFVWEVDPHRNTKVRLDAMGRFAHETAVVDPRTGLVYLTEDSGTDSLLYRMRPRRPGRLEKGGVLEAYRGRGRWVRIDDPLGTDAQEPAKQGIDKGAIGFHRLEGGRIRGRWFYFTETGDLESCGTVWRLHLDSTRLEVWAQDRTGRRMCMPDNVAFDRAGNLFLTEDKGDAGPDNPNRVLFVDRRTGEIATFAELVIEVPENEVGLVDEPTGPAFAPDGRVLFLNLQRGRLFGVTLAITGPFPQRTPRARYERPATSPPDAQPPERRLVESLRDELPSLSTMSLGEAAGLVALWRGGKIAEIPADLAEASASL
jgi:secreted PhoX family phosphatase